MEEPRTKLNPILFKSQQQIKALREKRAAEEAKTYTYAELRNLNVEKKKNYINKILAEDVKVNMYLHNVEDKLIVAEDVLAEAQYEMEDLQDNWDKEMTIINQNLYEKAVQNGITKEEYFHDYKFELFNIVDMHYD